MSGCPAICSVADSMPGPEEPSATAVTVSACDRFDQVVGATTCFTSGPCATHAPPRQTSFAAHSFGQAYWQTCRLLQVEFGPHSVSSLQVPTLASPFQQAKLAATATIRSLRSMRLLVDS